MILASESIVPMATIILGPRSPCMPCIPCVPCRPWAPVSPLAPCVPVAPVAPASPFATHRSHQALSVGTWLVLLSWLEMYEDPWYPTASSAAYAVELVHSPSQLIPAPGVPWGPCSPFGPAQAVPRIPPTSASDKTQV